LERNKKLHSEQLFFDFFPEWQNQKNHTAHNQNRKAHRNGILKSPRTYYSSTKGMDPKFLRNQRFAKKKSPKPCVQRKIAYHLRTMAQRHKDVVTKKFLARQAEQKVKDVAKKVAALKEKQKQRKEKKLQQPKDTKEKKERKPRPEKKNRKQKNPKKVKNPNKLKNRKLKNPKL